MNRPWYKELNRYQCWVVLVASLGWMFDTMDQRIFVLARGPAVADLVAPGTAPAEITWYSGIATAVFMAGWAVGGVCFGVLGDRWGRARTMMVTILAYSVFTGLSALSQSLWDFMAYRFLTGLGVGGEFAAGVTLVAEVTPATLRPHALGLLQAMASIGNIAGSAISLVVLPLGWRWMFLVGVFPALLVAAAFRKVREPETWVRAKELGALAGTRSGSLADLWKHRRWRRHTAIGLTLATCGVIGLWGIGFWTPELIRDVLRDLPAADRTWFVSIGTLVQDAGGFFGIAAFTAFTARAGRRIAFLAAFLLGLAATVLTFGWLREPSQVYWMLALLGFCNVAVFGGYAIYFPELYPTRLRSTGVGFCYNGGRVVAAAGPFTLGGLTVLFSNAGMAAPFRAAAISLAFVYLAGAATIYFAPETKDRPLPEE